MTEEGKNHPGMTPCYDENMKITRWLTPEEVAAVEADFDIEYMCPKSIADWRRKQGIPPFLSEVRSQKRARSGRAGEWRAW